MLSLSELRHAWAAVRAAAIVRARGDSEADPAAAAAAEAAAAAADRAAARAAERQHAVAEEASRRVQLQAARDEAAKELAAAELSLEAVLERISQRMEKKSTNAGATPDDQALLQTLEQDKKVCYRCHYFQFQD